MLFSKEGWLDLKERKIGVTDDSSTSAKLLSVLLEKKYGVQAHFERLHSGVNDYTKYDAVLLIGDEALRHNKSGLHGFELVFDLAREWYDWQRLPFVFAVWAMKKSLSGAEKEALRTMLADSLQKYEAELSSNGKRQGTEIGLTAAETQEYLEGFSYRLGERECEGMNAFRGLLTVQRNTDDTDINGSTQIESSVKISNDSM